MTIRYFLLVVLMLSGTMLMAQGKSGKAGKTENHIDQNFCNTMMGVVFHVSSNFDGIRGKELETTTEGGTRYASLKGIEGVRTSGIVNDGGWRYEGIILQDTSKKKVTAYYQEYAGHLDHCLPHSGYIRTEIANTGQGLESFPSLSYKYNTGTVTIEYSVDRSEINGVYTITLIIKK